MEVEVPIKVTVEDDAYWANRPVNDKRLDWRNGETSWIDGYKRSVSHPHRQLILERLKLFSPFAGVLELGCNAGPNLIRIAEQYPETQLAGVDINKDAIAAAQEALPKAILKVGNICTQPLPFADKSFDIVIIDAVLLYVGAKDIYKVLQEVNRVARRGVILVEWYDESVKGKIHEHHWARNYPELLLSFGFNVQTSWLTEELWPNKAWTLHGRCFTAARQ